MPDVTQYQSVIEETVSRFRFLRKEREDMVQECYIALLENQSLIEAAEDPEKQVVSLCKKRLGQLGREAGKEVRTESLDTPAHTLKFADPGLTGLLGSGITEEMLQEAILSLPFEQYRVIYARYVDGTTQVKLAQDLGLNRKTIQRLEAKGIKGLKIYFEETL